MQYNCNTSQHWSRSCLEILNAERNNAIGPHKWWWGLHEASGPPVAHALNSYWENNNIIIIIMSPGSCVPGSWTSWRTIPSWVGTDFVHTDSQLGHNRAVSSALFCIPCRPMTACQLRWLTTSLSLISGSNEFVYREEVANLEKWCVDNNLSLNVKKAK